MTSRNTRQAAGRSPQLQQLSDEASGTSALPVQGTEPTLPVARLPSSGKRGSLPMQRATYHGPVQNSDRPVAGAEPPLQSAGRLFRLTGRGARPHRRRSGTGLHGDLGSDGRRLSAGTPRVLAFRIHLALGHGDDVPATTARPPIPFRRTTTVRPSVDIPPEHRVTHQSRQVACPYTSPGGRNAESAHPHPPKLRQPARGRCRNLARQFAVCAWLGRTRFGGRQHLTSRLTSRTSRPMHDNPPDTPGAADLFTSTGSGGASYPIQVARSAILATPDPAQEPSDLRDRRRSRRRAIVLSGGVAAAVVAIVAVIVLALGQRSGTSPTATLPTDTSTSVQITAASAAAVVVTTAEPVLPTGTTAGQTNSAQAPATSGVTAVTTPTSTTPAAAAVGVKDTATVVTGTSKLTGWVPLSTPKP